MKKIERLLGIVVLLNRRKKLNAVDLAKYFEVDMRTIYRDIQALSELHVPIVSQTGPDGGYEILNEYFVPSIAFSKEEIFSLLISKKLIEQINIPGYSKSIKNAFIKIENATTNRQLERLKWLEERLIFKGLQKHIHLDEIKFFEPVMNGIEENKKLSISRIDNSQKELIINPIGVIYVDEVWQLIYKDNNTYNHVPLHWITNVTVLNESFQIEQDFNSQVYYCDHFCLLPCEKKIYDKSELVKIKIHNEGFYTVKDYLFFHEKHILSKNDDTTIIQLKLIEPNYYVHLAERFKNEIEILEPSWLRKLIFNESQKLYKLYKKN